MATRYQDVWGSPTLEQTRGQNAAAPAARPVPAPGLLESIGLGFRRAGAQEDWGFNQTRWSARAYGEMYAALRARGHDFGNLSWTDLAVDEQRQQAARNGRMIGPWTTLPNVARAREFWQAIEAERARDHNFLAGYGDVHDYSSFDRHVADMRSAEVNRLDAQAEGGSRVGAFIGQIAHAPFDPSSWVPIPGAAEMIGAETVARGVLAAAGRTALREGAANMVITAAQEPLVRQDAARLGHERTAEDFIYDEATAGIAGVGIGGAVHLAPHAARAAADALTPFDRRVAREVAAAPIDPNAHADVRMAQQFEAMVPREQRTPDQQMALNVVARNGQVRQGSPFTAGPAGDDEHAHLLGEHGRAVAQGALPSEVAPRAIRRSEVETGGGASGARSPAFEQVKARIHRAEAPGRDDFNESSGATGPYQFLASTWNSYYRRRYPHDPRSDTQIAALRRDPALNEQLMNDMLADNARALRQAGAPVTAGNLYLMHAAGPGAGAALLHADPHARAIDVYRSINPRNADAAYRGNPWLRGTAGEAVQWAHERMGGEAPAPIERAPDYAAAGGGDEIARGELDAAEIERLGEDHGHGHSDYEASLADGEQPPFDTRPVLRPELFDSPEEHARAQLAFEAERDGRDGFTHVIADEAAPGHKMAAPAAVEGAPARETATGGASGPAAEIASEGADVAGVVFHGTNRAFDRFELKTAMRNDGGPVEVEPQAHFFSDNRESAMTFAHDRSRIDAELRGLDPGVPRVSAHRLKIEQPLDFTIEPQDAPWLAENGFENWHNFDAPNPMLAQEMEHLTGHTIEDWQDVQRMLDDPAAVAALRKDGYDAVRLREDDGSDSWAVFDPKQIQPPAFAEIEAAALDRAAAARFADPVGEGPKTQLESAEHDVRMLPADAGTFRLDEEGGEISAAALLKEMDEARSAIKAMRACMAPAGGAA
jgi:hypothetical protein